MPLHVLQLLDPHRAVGVAGAADPERLADLLDAALVAAGHLSTVVAAEHSRVRGRLVAISTDGGVEETLEEIRQVVGELLANGSFDVVHVHGRMFRRYLPASAPPTLVTLHETPELYPEEVFSGPDGLRLSCVTGSQRRSCPASARLVESIPPGAELREPALRRFRLVVTAGALPSSGTVRELCGADFRLIHLTPGAIGDLIPGPAGPELIPRRGEASREREVRLIRSASALLVSDGARSGALRIAVEAISAGTPVVALRGGPLDDVVEHGRTGFLVDSAAAIPAAVLRAGQIAREECRSSAARRFDGAKMVRRYLQLYERLVRGAEPIGEMTGHEAPSAPREELGG